ncbi:MAG: hypothetical protein AAFO29_24425, partial [Actinomycetota bacterium]
MRIPDDALAEIDTTGFTIVESFLSGDELAAAQAGVWDHHPRPEDYFADPDAHPHLRQSGFAGIDTGFPFTSWDLSRLCVHPDL